MPCRYYCGDPREGTVWVCSEDLYPSRFLALVPIACVKVYFVVVDIKSYHNRLI